jgi:GNAT superfamily N-acetyltransferase/uncharacterized glyoxalase superfamily protein PhnB
MIQSPPSAPDYGRSLAGLGFNLIVKDVARAVRFATQVLEAQVNFQTSNFAAMRLCGQDFMFHADETYRSNALYGSLAVGEARGVGVELRAYGLDPDAAEGRARAAGFTVLAGALDKPHGLRECMIMDDEGFVWVPSVKLLQVKTIDLANGYYQLPQGKLLNVVICLEMLAKPAAIGPGLPEGFTLQRLSAADLGLHRAIFREVGADLLWFSRLIMPDEELAAHFSDPDIHSFTLMQGAAPVGLLELNFAEKQQCELAFFGISGKAIGTGLGKALMNEALARAWAQPINRLWVHTCHYDHPRALGFYQKAGFKPYARMIEVHDDPRASGHLPYNVAAHVPMVDNS